jgi:hypothetical protein
MCSICFTHMSQQYVPNVSIVLVLCCSKCFHVASCNCFIWMLHIFHTYIANVCSRCFICFRRMSYFKCIILNVFHVFGELGRLGCVCGPGRTARRMGTSNQGGRGRTERARRVIRTRERRDGGGVRMKSRAN